MKKMTEEEGLKNENAKLLAMLDADSLTIGIISNKLKKAILCIENSLRFLEQAPFDFRNGNTYEGFDEGEVLGNNYLSKLVKDIKGNLKDLKDE